jgi:metal-responsive CopG/Arc/MetJ family transcriptional regulator
MAEADTPEKSTVNIRMTDTFLEDVDRSWKAEGYNSRSEFIRSVLRDAIKHPDFNRADLKAMLASEVEIQDGDTQPSDEVKAAHGLAEHSDDA